MKKFIFTGILCFLVSLSFGQKKAISSAKSEMKGNSPNIAEARLLINGALKDPETINDAEAWYVAGLIENKQFDLEKMKEIMGKPSNEEVMYNALERIIPYFLKAAELDQLPDAKGKVSPKFLKDIRSIIRANRMYYINAGLYTYNLQNFQKAYSHFKQFGDIPALDIFKGEKMEAGVSDTTELQIKFYAGMAAARIPDGKAAIAIYNEIKNGKYFENDAFTESDLYKELAREYMHLDDSVAFEKLIKDGLVKFPDDDFYVRSMVDLSITSGKLQEAIPYLEQAIVLSPNSAQLYAILGQLYDDDKKQDEAIKNLKKAVELEPENTDYLSELGRIYFNLGVENRKTSDETTNANQSKEFLAQSLNYFREALPYYEKIFKLDATHRSAIHALHVIYYALDRQDDFLKMDALLSDSDK